jgi:hypothetical protein
MAASFSKINADGQSSGRFAAILVLAAILFPCLLPFLPVQNSPKFEALIYMPLCFPPAVAYVYVRRTKIQAIQARISKPIASRLRGVAALSLITAGIAGALAAKQSSLAAVCALLLVLSLPWTSWSGLQRAP